MVRKFALSVEFRLPKLGALPPRTLLLSEEPPPLDSFLFVGEIMLPEGWIEPLKPLV